MRRQVPAIAAALEGQHHWRAGGIAFRREEGAYLSTKNVLPHGLEPIDFDSEVPEDSKVRMGGLPVTASCGEAIDGCSQLRVGALSKIESTVADGLREGVEGDPYSVRGIGQGAGR